MSYTRTRGERQPPHVGPPEWRQDADGWWFYREGSNRRKGVVKQCGLCGNDFLVTIECAGKRKFCSRTCSARNATPARDQARMRRSGPESPNWKGGRHVRKRDGYVQIRITASTGERVYVLEHRHVMEQHLGRPLLASDTVHHRNGDKSDNRIENLELRVGRHGKGATEAHCRTCTCFAH